MEAHEEFEAEKGLVYALTSTTLEDEALSVTFAENEGRKVNLTEEEIYKVTFCIAENGSIFYRYVSANFIAKLLHK